MFVKTGSPPLAHSSLPNPPSLTPRSLVMETVHSFQSGKYAGKLIADPSVPSSYLRWCVENFKPNRFRAAIEEELVRRDGCSPTQPSPGGKPASASASTEKLPGSAAWMGRSSDATKFEAIFTSLGELHRKVDQLVSNQAKQSN